MADQATNGSLNASKDQDSDFLNDSEEEIDGDGRKGEQLSSTPPLILISSRVKQFMALVKSRNPGVAVVYYNYQTTTLTRLLQYVGDVMRGRKAYCIAFVVHGQAGNFKLISQKVVTIASLKEDKELQTFFTELVSNYLFTEGALARIDILNCPIEEDAEGKQVVNFLSKLTGVPVYSSKDIWGAELHQTSNNEDGPVKIGTLYFDVQRLKDWCSAQNDQMKLDKYEKIRIVGQGAYGQAVLYRRKDDDSKVILKKTNVLDLKKAERLSVLNEIKILSMLDHPHIISYYDSFEEDGVMMIEMEYAEGGSLQQYLKQQVSPLSELDVLTKFSQMVDAIRYIHIHNILHRDLKTANVFLSRQGNVKLGDFGISKVLSATHQEAHTMVGTPYYISPEICEGKLYNDKSDIWALGCILYEMLCLHKTFDGTNLPALVHKIVEGTFEPIKGQYSEGLKQLVKQMLQKNPSIRPSAEQLHVKLVPVLLKPVQEKAGVLPLLPDLVPDDESNTKSFLYYLDGSTFLLKPVAFPFQEKIINVAIGYSHTVVVTVDLSVYSWGENAHGQLGHGDLQSRRQPTVIEALNGRNINSAKCGGEFSIFMNENGIVMSCGKGNRGVLGHGNTRDYSRPEMIQELLTHDVQVLECGESHVVMLNHDGMVFVWGSGDCGRLGTGSGDDCLKPTKIKVRSPGTRMDETVRDIRCGTDSTVFITDVGRLFACGNNTDNKLGLNRRETFLMQMKKLLNKHQLQVPCCSTPTPIKELGKERIVDCSLGPTHSTFLTDTGLIYTFGRNAEAQLGGGNCMPTDMPTVVKGLSPKPVSVTSMELATVVATESNSFYLWGSRPVIESPMKAILSGEHDMSVAPNQDVSSPDSGYRESPSPNRNHSTGEQYDFKSISIGLNETNLKKDQFIEPVKEPQDGERTNPTAQVHHKSSLEAILCDTPHKQIICSNSGDYLTVLYQNLNLLSSKQDAKVSRQMSTASVHPFKSTYKNKGSHASVDAINVTSEGYILTPLSIDLVDKSGVASALWKQGIQKIKLEDISCFGSNVIILFHGQLSQKGVPVTLQKKNSFVVGPRLRRSLVNPVPFPISPENKRFHRPDTVAEVKGENEEDKQEGVVNSQFSKEERPMSPTAELPTWLKGDLKDGIPIKEGAPLPERQTSTNTCVDESHGWFPNSFRKNVIVPVEGTLPHGSRNHMESEVNTPVHNLPSKDNGGLYRSPSVPPSDSLAGIHRLPPPKKAVLQEPSHDNPISLKNSYVPSKMAPAKSITNLPTKSVAPLGVKKAQSSSNVSRKPRVNSGQSKVATSSVNQSGLPNRREATLHKSTTTSAMIDVPGAQSAKRRPSEGNTHGIHSSAKTESSRSDVSPYSQPVANFTKKKTGLKKRSASRPHGRSEEELQEEKERKESEILMHKIEEEREKFKRIVEENDRQAVEKEKKLNSEIDELRERLKKVEAENQDIIQIKEQLSRLTKNTSVEDNKRNNVQPNPPTKYCIIL